MKMNTTGMRRLIPYLKKYRFKITGAILLIIAASCLIALSPTLEGMITTQLFQDVTAGHGVNFTVIYRIVAVLLLVYVTGALCNCSYQFLLTDAIQSAMVDLRNDVESKIRRLPIAYFDQHPLGDTMSRVSNDMETISNALQQSFAQILNAILGLSLAVAMMFSIQWKMALAFHADHRWLRGHFQDDCKKIPAPVRKTAELPGQPERRGSGKLYRI